MKIGRKKNADHMPRLVFTQGAKQDGCHKKGKDQRPACKEDQNISIYQVKKPV